MKGKYFSKIGGLILIAVLTPAAVMFLSSTTAEAQRRGRVIIVQPVHSFYGPWWGYRRFGPYPYYGYYNQYVFGSSESGYNQGYHDGLKTGENDARRHKSYDPERSHYYHDAGFGNFAGAYREGFEHGYANGFRA